MRCSEWYVADEYLALAAQLLSPDILQVIWRAAEAATRWVRYLRVSEEGVQGTILRP